MFSTVAMSYLLVKICTKGTIAVPEVLNIVSYSKNGRGDFVDLTTRVERIVFRRQVITTMVLLSTFVFP